MPEILDAYIRVSRVDGRSGDSYHSPDIQEQSIRRWIGDRGVELGVVVKEQDVSGGTAVSKRRLNELLLRVENGVSHGIIVYETDRFGRNLRETLNAHHRLNEMNARLVGVEDGVDTSTPGGKSRLQQRAMMAEDYLDDIKRRWQRTTDRRVAQGKSVGGVPMGYRRRDQVPELQEHDDKRNLIRDGRLVVHDAEAELVLRAFQLRASGSPMIEICRLLGVVKSTGSKMLRNRAYLGELRGPGGAINRHAHDPIIGEDLFAAVQARRGERIMPTPRKPWNYQPILKGLLRCGECGYLMRVVGGLEKPTYYCQSKSNNRPCPGCAASARLLDEYVLEQLERQGKTVRDLYMGAEIAWAQARHRVAAAEKELDQFVEVAVGLDRERFKAGLDQRQDAVNQAKARLYDLDDPGIGDEDLWVFDFREAGPPKDRWYDLIERLENDLITQAEYDERLNQLRDEMEPLVWERTTNPDRERRRMRRVIAKVTVKKADPKHRRHQPISERAFIQWVGAGDPSEDSHLPAAGFAGGSE